MAQAAEEYGSHDKTFEIPAAGTVQVVDGAGDGADRARASSRRHLARLPDQGRADPRLGEARRHPRPRHRRAGGVLARRGPRPRRQPDREGQGVPARARHRRASTIEIMAPAEATAYSLERIRQGEDTISVTGNVLRDYNTDLFPILELGTRRQDALGRPADERRRPVRDRRRRLGAQARAAAGQGELPALGQPGRVLRPGRVASSSSPSTTGNAARPGAGRHPRPGHRHVPRREQVADPPGRRHRQPRLALLPGAVLGPGAGQQTDDAELAARVRGRSPSASRGNEDDDRRAS